MNFKYFKSGPLITSILILAFLFTPVSNYLEKAISKNQEVNTVYSFIGVFSVLSLLTGSLFLINKILWKCKVMKWLIDIPNLNGRYEGELVSLFIDANTGLPTRKKCVIEIKQNASQIKIFSYYGELSSNKASSESKSISEEIVKNPNDVFEVFYLFSNDPNTLEQQLANHFGTCSLKYFSDTKTLKGSYYNQRGLKGETSVSFVQRKLLGRFSL